MTFFITLTVCYFSIFEHNMREIDQVIEGQKTAPMINDFAWLITQLVLIQITWFKMFWKANIM